MYDSQQNVRKVGSIFLFFYRAIGRKFRNIFLTVSRNHDIGPNIMSRKHLILDHLDRSSRTDFWISKKKKL